MNATAFAPSAYEVGCQSIRLWDEQSAGEGLDVANEFLQRFGDDPAAMAEFNRGVEDEKVRRNLTA